MADLYCMHCKQPIDGGHYEIHWFSRGGLVIADAIYPMCSLEHLAEFVKGGGGG